MHLDDSLRKLSLDKGRILVITGRGIAGDVQVIDTQLYKEFKSVYTLEECKLSIKQLDANPEKILQPSRSSMLERSGTTCKKIKVDS